MDELEIRSGTATTVDGTRIAYQVSGSGPPLVCCHAMGADQNMWQPQREAFSQAHQFITFDQRGSGKSDHPAFKPGADCAYATDSFGDDLASVLDALGIEKAHVLGFSMGAVAALSFATRWPERVERLVLASAMASRLPEEIIARAQQVVKVLDSSGIEETYEFYFSGPMFEGMNNVSSFRDLLAQAQSRATPHGFKGCFRVTIDRPSMLQELAAIDAPTLVLVGEFDRHYLSEADTLCSHLPDSKKVIIPDAGHAMTAQNPTLFAKEVLSFLA